MFPAVPIKDAWAAWVEAVCLELPPPPSQNHTIAMQSLFTRGMPPPTANGISAQLRQVL